MKRTATKAASSLDPPRTGQTSGKRVRFSREEAALSTKNIIEEDEDEEGTLDTISTLDNLPSRRRQVRVAGDISSEEEGDGDQESGEDEEEGLMGKSRMNGRSFRSNRKGKMPQGSMDEEEEEEEDMFAEEDRKPISQKGKYLSQEDIEGQAMDPSVMDNEENAIPLEPFNVRAEMEEGAFKEDGTYVRDAPDPEARHDVWLQGMASTDVISEAKEAQDRREKEARMNETRSRQEALDPQEAQAILARLLQPGETPLKAMRRLGGTGKSKSWKDRIKKQKDVTMDDVGMDRAKLLSDLTRTCDQLLSSGMLDVYEKTQEDFALASTPAPSSTGGARWEFRWSSEDTTIHGPYSDEEMEAWRIQGYFGSEVCVRRVNTGDEGGEGRWLSVDQVDFD